MKKISLMTLLLATSSTATFATETVEPYCRKAFEGLYIGGNIGYAVGGGKQKETDFRTFDTVNTVHSDLRVQGVHGGIGAGYAHRICEWAVGLAFDANWSNVRGRHIRNTTSRAAGALEKLTSKAREKNSLQLYVRTGYVIAEKVMPFIGIGWDNSSWRFRVTDNIVDLEHTKERRKRLNGLMWKVGVDVLAMKNFVIGFEYTGSVFNRISTRISVNTPFDESNVRSRYSPSVHKFALTAKYYF
jgi:opacity protein-like surface antigen